MSFSVIKNRYYIFFALFILFLVNGKVLELPVYEQVSMVCLGLVSFLYICFNAYKEDIRKVFLYTLLFQFVCSLILKSEFILFAESPHGPSADDGILYLEYAKKGAFLTSKEFIDYVSDTQWNNIDDYGFLFYLRAICKIFPDILVPYVLLFLNAFYISLGAAALFRTMLLIDGTNPWSASLATSVFSSFLFFVNSSAVGLKEDLFVPIICFSIYYMVAYYISRRIPDLIKLAFWIAMTAFFRLSITLILILIFVVGLVSTNSNKKKIAWGFLLSIVISPILLDLILKFFLGMSLEFIMDVANARYDQTDTNSSAKKIGDMVAAFVGPFPNFSSTIDSIFYSYSSLLKMLLNLPVLAAVYLVFRRFMYNYYFITFFYVIGIMMTFISGTGLDLRYHIPFFPAYIILFHLFLNNYEVKKWIWIGFVVFCGLLVYFYNALK